LTGNQARSTHAHPHTLPDQGCAINQKKQNANTKLGSQGSDNEKKAAPRPWREKFSVQILIPFFLLSRIDLLFIPHNV
jgi:hypothetical protein